MCIYIYIYIYIYIEVGVQPLEHVDARENELPQYPKINEVQARLAERNPTRSTQGRCWDVRKGCVRPQGPKEGRHGPPFPHGVDHVKKPS